MLAHPRSPVKKVESWMLVDSTDDTFVQRHQRVDDADFNPFARQQEADFGKQARLFSQEPDDTENHPMGVTGDFRVTSDFKQTGCFFDAYDQEPKSGVFSLDSQQEHCELT